MCCKLGRGCVSVSYHRRLEEKLLADAVVLSHGLDKVGDGDEVVLRWLLGCPNRSGKIPTPVSCRIRVLADKLGRIMACTESDRRRAIGKPERKGCGKLIKS